MANEKTFVYEIKINGTEQQAKKLEQIEQELRKVQVLRRDGINVAGKEIEVGGKILKNNAQLIAAEKSLIQEKNKLNKAINNTIRQNKAASGSYDSLTAANSRLSARLRQLEDPLGKNAASFRRISSEINRNEQELKQLDAAMGRYQRNVGNYSGGIMSAFKGIGTAVTGVVGAYYAFNSLIQGSIDSYDAQVKAEAKLLTALKGRVDIQKRLVNEASFLQTLTLFPDEAIVEAQAFLATMGLTEEAIMRLTPLVQDFATKQNLDLVSAADLVAKSIGSSTNALKRYGITIEGAVGSSERLESAVIALSNAVGGQAVAAAQAGTGAIQQFKNEIDDTKEGIGKMLTVATGYFIRFLKEAANPLSRVIRDTNKFISDSLKEWSEYNTKISSASDDEIAVLLKQEATLYESWGKQLKKAKEQGKAEDIKYYTELINNQERYTNALLAEFKKRRAGNVNVETTGTGEGTVTRRTVKDDRSGLEAIAQQNKARNELDELIAKNIESDFKEIDALIKANDVRGTSIALYERQETAIERSNRRLREGVELARDSADAFGMLGQQFDKNTAIYKASVLAQQAAAAAETLIAITVGTARTAQIGFPQNIPMLIGFAAQVAGLVNTIRTLEFAGGGRVPYGYELPGFPKSGDNTPAMLKPDEVVLNATQQAALGGANTFRKIGVPGFADGGIPQSPSTIAASNLRRSIDTIKVEVVESEVRGKMKYVDVVEKLTRF